MIRPAQQNPPPRWPRFPGRDAASRPVLLAALVSALLLAACGGPGAPPPEREGATGEFVPIEERDPLNLGLAGSAKVLCSAVFVSGREAGEAFHNSAYHFLPEGTLDAVSYEVDREARMVAMTHPERGLTRRARLYGDQGCIIHARGEEGIHFTPVPVETTLPPAGEIAWPMGDRPVSNDPPEGVEPAALEAAVDRAFAREESLTAAFLVLHRGRIVAERYRPDVDRHTQLESWSMGKSLTAALVGRLIEQGELVLDEPAPVPAWHEDPEDPRGEITVAQLLRMSSGLHFIAPRDPDYTPEMGYPDHLYIYTGAIDAFRFSIRRGLQFPPGTEGRYRNSDPLTLGYLVRETVRRRGGEYLTFPRRELFDRIGIRRQVLETDPWGNFLLTGYDYGTARNWARLGLLFLRDGVWQGERLLPEGFVEFVSTPAPAWDEPVYGGLFWLNRTGRWSLPEDAYAMAGGGGQRVFVVPSLDLVVVRMGHFRGNQPGMEDLDAALAGVVEAVGG